MNAGEALGERMINTHSHHLNNSAHECIITMAMQDRAKANHDLGKDAMINQVLAKGTMVNHDLARLTMIMASVPWLRTLGRVRKVD